MARAKFQTNQLTPDEIAVVQSLESLANSATNERLQKVAGVIVNTATGDVVGPATSTDNTVPRWNGTDNKTLQASTVSISDGGVLTLGANGVSGFDAISYQQLQDALAGLKAKQSVVCATTADGTFATDFDNGSTVDGVTLTTGDRILIKNQTASELNGIYIVEASGAPTRSSDANTWDELVSAYVYVEEGTANADKGFICTINSGGTLGTDPVTWTGFSSSGGGITSLNALTDASQTFSTGTTGTDFAISSAGGVHTFNIPDASGSARGLITTGSQTIAGAKTFSNAPVFSSVTASQILKVDAGKALTSGLIALGSEVSGTLPIANGGTNSTAALNNNRFIVSSGGAIGEHGAVTANRALATDANGLPAASATTDTELGYVSGVTSAIQTQLGGKVPYTGASSNVDLGANSLTTSDVLTTDVQAQGSSGIIIKNSAGTQQASFGLSAGTNATINGTTNIGEASADYHQVAGGTGTITDTATGSSTDININLVPKGSGRVQAGGNNVYYSSGTDVALADGGTGASLTDPNADRIMFWDDSAGSVAWLTAGTGLTITDTTIAASGAGNAPDFLPIGYGGSWLGNGGCFYSDDTSGFIAGGTSSNDIVCLGGNYMFPSTSSSNLVYKSTSGNAQQISTSTISSGYSLTATMIQGGYVYVSLQNGVTGEIYRADITSDISSAGNWTQLTISGTTLGNSSLSGLVGYGDGKFWYYKSGTGLVPYTLSGTTLTSGTAVTPTGEANTKNMTRVNDDGIYNYYSAAPFIRFSDFSGTLDSTRSYRGNSTNFGLFCTADSIYSVVYVGTVAVGYQKILI